MEPGPTQRVWRLAAHPTGLPTTATWTLDTAPVPQPRAGEILARALYLDVAPYMRGRISPQKNYAAGVKPGDRVDLAALRAGLTARGFQAKRYVP